MVLNYGMNKGILNEDESEEELPRATFRILVNSTSKSDCVSSLAVRCSKQQNPLLLKLF